MSDFDEIHEASDPGDDTESHDDLVLEPIVIRGNGNITVFGLNNRFSSEFPCQLVARVAPEEFKATVHRINDVLRKTMPTRHSVEKALEWENNNLYLKLRLRWKLAKHHCDNSSMLEYVLLIEFLPRVPLNQPD